jgi:hypothetical protein
MSRSLKTTDGAPVRTFGPDNRQTRRSGTYPLRTPPWRRSTNHHRFRGRLQ